MDNNTNLGTSFRYSNESNDIRIASNLLSKSEINYYQTEEYRSLYEKFKLSHALYKEKEQLYKYQYDIIKKDNEILKLKCKKLFSFVKNQDELKKSFYIDATNLEQASILLNTRKNTIENELNETNKINKNLSEENHSMNKQIIELLSENKELSSSINDNYIPIDLYNDCINKLSNYENNYIPKELYYNDIDNLKKIIKDECVSINDYNNIKELYNNTINNKKHLEESLNSIDNEKSDLILLNNQLEVKNSSLRERVESTERELKTLYSQLSQSDLLLLLFNIDIYSFFFFYSCCDYYYI